MPAKAIHGLSDGALATSSATPRRQSSASEIPCWAATCLARSYSASSNEICVRIMLSLYRAVITRQAGGAVSTDINPNIDRSYPVRRVVLPRLWRRIIEDREKPSRSDREQAAIARCEVRRVIDEVGPGA